MAEYQKETETGKTSYRVRAWWDVQCGCECFIEADSPEEALEQANRLVASEQWDLGDSETYDDSDGPTNLEVVEGSAVLAEDLSGEERLNRAAPDMLAALEAQILPRAKGWKVTDWDIRDEQARAAIAKAKGV